MLMSEMHENDEIVEEPSETVSSCLLRELGFDSDVRLVGTLGCQQGDLAELLIS